MGCQRDRQHGVERPERLAGIHVNMPTVGPDRDTLGDLTPSEQQALDDLSRHTSEGMGLDPAVDPPADAGLRAHRLARRAVRGSPRSSGPGPTTTATPRMRSAATRSWTTCRSTGSRPRRRRRPACTGELHPALVRAHRRAVGHLDLPPRDLPSVAAGRAALQGPALVRDARPGRALRRLRGAGPLRRPGPGLLPHRALSPGRRPAACWGDALLALDLLRPAVARPARRPPRRCHGVGRRVGRRPLHGQRLGPDTRHQPDPRGRLARRRSARCSTGCAPAPWCTATPTATRRCWRHGGDGRPGHRRPIRARHRRRLAGQRARAVRHRAAAGRARRSTASRKPSRSSAAS